MSGKSLFISVGDPSADRHAAKLIARLKQENPDLDVWGMGGDHMEAAGARLDFKQASKSTIGLIEVLKHVPRLAALRVAMLKELERVRPDAILLMDFGGFNVGFANMVRPVLPNTPIVYFISPQVWASRPWRINAIKKFVTKMLVIFPFEEAIYRKAGIDTSFVGHPLTYTLENTEILSREEFASLVGLDPEKPIIGIFPGSRNQEIRSHLKILLGAMDWLSSERPDLQFVVSTASQSFADAFYLETDRLGYNRLIGKCVKTISSDHNQSLMARADLLWTKSGTTTLEATLHATPMLIFYHANWLTFLIFLAVKTVKNVGWPNLLGGKDMIPELLQLDCRADQLVRYTRDWLDAPGLRRELRARLKVLRHHLGQGDFTENAAREIAKILCPQGSITEESCK